MREEPVDKRIKDLSEVVLGYTLEEAKAEVSRCLTGVDRRCIECDECQ